MKIIVQAVHLKRLWFIASVFAIILLTGPVTLAEQRTPGERFATAIERGYPGNGRK